MTKISLLIIDDHSIVRAGIRSTLSNNKHINIVGDASDGKDGLEKIKEFNPDCVILDLSLPVLSGLELTKIIREEFPCIKILIFTMHEEVQLIISAIEQGINGYLLKSTDLNEIEKAIVAINAGENYFNNHISNIMAGAISLKKQCSGLRPECALTEREKQVLINIIDGLSNKMIAERLGISENTVANHRTNILRKTNSSNTADLVRKAISDKLMN